MKFILTYLSKMDAESAFLTARIRYFGYNWELNNQEKQGIILRVDV